MASTRRSTKVKPGRPPKDAGTDAPDQRVVTAAMRLFLERGYQAVTTDLLAREARVSKSTIYRHFGDMPGVLRAVVERAGDAFRAGVNAEPSTARELRDSLVTYGSNLLELLNLEHCRRIDQMIHEQARQHPELARLFYESSYGRSHREVTALVAAAAARGAFPLSVPPDVFADNLISMWEGLANIRSRLNLTERPFPKPKQWATHCTDLCLQALGPARDRGA